MNCADWQMKIAAEDPAAAEHMSGCDRCREFASELSENGAAIRSIAVDPAAYTAVRARVMASVQARRRFGWAWAAGAAAAAAVIVALSIASRPVPELPRPQAITYHIAPPEWRPAPVQHRVRGRTERKPALAAIKLLTDDPNVVIIWLVDNKQGDSL